MDNLIKLLSQVPDKTRGLEALYVNPFLLDALFNDLFGGVAKILQLVEDMPEHKQIMENSGGIENSIVSWFAKLKTDLSAESQDEADASSIVESKLTLTRKMKICEAALEDADLIVDNPSSQPDTYDKYLRFKDTLPTFTMLEEAKLTQTLGAESTKLVIKKWQRIQSLTPGHTQVALTSNTPFPMTGIIETQDGLNGSIYISSPPEAGSSRSVLAKILYKEKGISFLNIYWVADKTPLPSSQ